MKKIFFASLLILGLSLTSCDDYLDINKDPNSPSQENMTPDMMLPAVEVNLCHSYGDFLRTVSGYFTQYYAQYFGTSNYLDYSQFNMSPTRSSSTYTQLNTRVLNNIKTIRDLAKADEDWGTYLAATVLRAFTYQVLVDCYGEVPYTQAQNLDYLTPEYDEGTVIYDGILAEIDEALDKVSGTEQVATSLLFPGANASSWIKFANALKLRILTRESGVKDVNGLIGALIDEDNFPSSNVELANCWKNEAGQANPFYMEDAFASYGASQQNIVLNIALLGTMADYEDSRLEAYFSPNSDGVYTGSVSGTNFSTTASYKASYWCRPNAHYDDPVVLISTSDVNFYIAEYYAKNNDAEMAQLYYRKAIEASFDNAGVSGADAAIEAYPLGSNWKQAIGIQKWVDLSGYNSFEGWCELRRLGYPAMGAVTGDQLYNEQTDSYNPNLYVPGTLYKPIKCNTALNGGILQRFPYAESSANRNQNTPDYPGDSAPVFWAK